MNKRYTVLLTVMSAVLLDSTYDVLTELSSTIGIAALITWLDDVKPSVANDGLKLNQISAIQRLLVNRHREEGGREARIIRAPWFSESEAVISEQSTFNSAVLLSAVLRFSGRDTKQHVTPKHGKDEKNNGNVVVNSSGLRKKNVLDFRVP
ncbi:hypothetical protein JOB18_006943 [Solea senegalensis]|uniref:Uncharacterized protein n=1 Tax=Solea senegalensis TaxID=28829 RepID=A0AAV6Q6U9_SOLSE|nr:hypothetical protein JOB18_006943 [Solea senegalensis]